MTGYWIRELQTGQLDKKAHGWRSLTFYGDFCPIVFGLFAERPQFVIHEQSGLILAPQTGHLTHLFKFHIRGEPPPTGLGLRFKSRQTNSTQLIENLLDTRPAYISGIRLRMLVEGERSVFLFAEATRQNFANLAGTYIITAKNQFATEQAPFTISECGSF